MATLRKNKKLRRTILQGMRPVEFLSDAGIYLGRRTVFSFPIEVYESVMERTARGLYYHHFNEILGPQVRCEVSFLCSLDPEFFELSANWSSVDIGSGAVVYRYSRAADAPRNTEWIFQFYESHWALVKFEPA
ncbi:MAG: hypothetical protein ABIP64_15740 [Burkholderiales bacterium]